MDNKYPIGGYAPGSYRNTCCTCGNQFTGDKRAVQCEPCAIKDKEAFDALSPDEQEAVVKRNAAIANFMFSGPLTTERELIYRIVSNWGNAIEMGNMEGWVKEYAAQAGTKFGGLPVREKAEQWFKEEVDKIEDEERKKEVLLEEETYIGVWMQGYNTKGAVWVKDALQWAKEAIEFADKQFNCPQYLVETWGNMIMNALNAIDEAQKEVNP